MKMSTGMVGMLLVALLTGANAIDGLVISPKWKAVIGGIVVGATALLQILAHVSNPDGTSANLPAGLTPIQLEEYRKQFLQAADKAKAAGAVVLCLLFAGMAPARAQGLPERFGAAGMGFQSASAPQTSGWAAMCLKAAERIYTCGATDYAAGSSSARAEVDTLLVSSGPITIFAKGGAGAATSTTGVGGSFAGGGVATLDLSKLLRWAAGVYAVASITLVKNDVTVTGSAFGGQSVFRFGFGRSF